MEPHKKVFCTLMAIAIVVGVAAPASATTLVRQGLENLVASNETVMVGEVLDAQSYWNAEGNFILTDVHIQAHEMLKGEGGGRELTVTLMGGTVGDVTTLIVGGAELIPGNSYVLFLNQEDLPGAPSAVTVRDHCQGAYDLLIAGDGSLRAVSQANRHPLVPDARGYIDAPGGVEGFPLNAMRQSILDLVNRPLNLDEEVEQ